MQMGYRNYDPLSQEIKSICKRSICDRRFQSCAKSDGCYEGSIRNSNDDLGKKGELLWRLMEEQDFFCLIGSPVGHSGSPAMYNYSFQKTEQDYVYLAFDVDLDKTEEAVSALKALGCKGLM